MLEINVSTETEQVLKDLAAQTGQNVADYAGRIVENEISKNQSGNGNNKKVENINQSITSEKKYMRMKGMFSSNQTDTSERMSELLKEENFDPAEGFSIK